MEYTARLFFVPDLHLGRDLDSEQFASKAFLYGKVMQLDEFVNLFNTGNLGVIHPDKGEIRILDYCDTCVEFCPHCECEVELRTEFVKQICPNCGEIIAPCNLCGGECIKNCPLGAR